MCVASPDCHAMALVVLDLRCRHTRPECNVRRDMWWASKVDTLWFAASHALLLLTLVPKCVYPLSFGTILFPLPKDRKHVYDFKTYLDKTNPHMSSASLPQQCMLSQTYFCRVPTTINLRCSRRPWSRRLLRLVDASRRHRARRVIMTYV